MELVERRTVTGSRRIDRVVHSKIRRLCARLLLSSGRKRIVRCWESERCRMRRGMHNRWGTQLGGITISRVGKLRKISLLCALSAAYEGVRSEVLVGAAKTTEEKRN